MELAMAFGWVGYWFLDWNGIVSNVWKAVKVTGFITPPCQRSSLFVNELPCNPFPYV
jgi:hypothetical protein